MANWTSTDQSPTRSGEYRCKCGNSGDTFWALWDNKSKCWTDYDGDEVAFGPRDVGDMWRHAKRRKKK